MQKTILCLAVVVTILASSCQEQKTAVPSEGNNSKDTHFKDLANLTFEKDYPTKETTLKLDEELYFQRAVQTYLWALPAVNMYAMKEGLGKINGEGYHVMSVFEQRLKPNTIITTPNSDVIYGLSFADLSKTGPLVIEAPANLQGLMDDFWHRPLTGPNIKGRQFLGDIGIPGPDMGKGGKYLIVPDDYKGKIDEKKYFVYKSSTNGVFIFLRGFFQDINNLEPGVKAVEGIKIYPLNGGAKEEMKFAHSSNAAANALFAHDFSYFEMLDRFIKSEKTDKKDPYMHGVLASIGIGRDSKFEPTAREKELLDLAAQTAWKMSKNIAANFDREYKGLWWKDRHWVAHGKTEFDDFMHVLLNEEFAWRETNYTDVNAKAHMFINHYSISTGMISSVVGLGAKYAGAYKDSEGNYLTGENTYRITIPANVPAKLFWSLTAYEFSTASGLPAGQEYPSLNSLNALEYNADSSVTFYFAPEQPEGKKNWIKTIPNKGWFSLIRLYGPDQAFFDRKFKPGDFEKIK
ncbi:MAG: DUF1254 domain-containing protein [Cytophaga sp.]|uniref:DUF1254 domain-containing protein n=1 Tax=Cytophaga sp. TaxID=29535 RepID=UPI003F818C81